MTSPDSFANPVWIIGLMLAGFLALTAILANGLAWRDRRAHPLCALAVILALSPGVLALGLSGVLGLELVDREGSTARWLLVVGGVIAIGLMLAALVVGLLGLASFRREGEYLYGWKRAVASTAGTVMLLIAGSVGVALRGLPSLPAGSSKTSEPVAATAPQPGTPTVAAADPQVGRFTSPNFGWSADFNGTRWTRPWPTMAADSPIAEWGLQNEDSSGAIIVAPLWLADQSLNLETASSALLSRFNLAPGSDAIHGTRECEQGGMRGREFFHTRRDLQRAFAYRFRVLIGRHCAYFLAGWMNAAIAGGEEELGRAFDRVKFDPKMPAPKAAQFSEHTRRSQAMLCNDAGITFAQGKMTAEGLAWIRRAADLMPKESGYVINYVDLAQASGRGAEGLAFLSERLPRFPGDRSLELKRANTLFANGDLEGALRAFGQLFSGGFRDDEILVRYVSQLTSRDRTGEAMLALDRYAADRDSLAIRRQRAEVLVAQGDSAAAEKLLQSMRTAAPNDPAAALALADHYYAQQRYEDSIAECNQLIAAGQITAAVFQRRGMAELSLKRYKDARASLQKALEKAPADTEIKKLTDQIAGLLNEGAKGAPPKAIAPVAIPKALLAPGRLEPGDQYGQGYTAVYDCKVMAIECGRGRETKTTEYAAVTLRDQRGVEYFSSLDFSFDPATEELAVNSLVVKDERGRPLATPRAEDAYLMDDKSGSAAQKVLHLPLTGLKPGHSFEYMVTRRELTPAKAIPFRSHIFSQHLPVLRSVLYVKASGAKLKSEASGGVPEGRRNGEEFTWIMPKPGVYRYEPFQAPLDKFLPVVWVSDAALTWPGEVKAYLEDLQERLAIEPSVTSTAEVAVRHCTTEAEQIQTLARWVQKELAYKPLDFGPRTRFPNAATQTLRNRSGDSKDHALVLLQMCQSVGLEAHLALVNTSSQVRANLPTLDQFDRVLVHFPNAADGARFIDPTSKVHDLRIGPPPGLAGRQALILDPEKPRLESIPDYGADASRANVTREVSFPNESDAEVVESVSFTGICGDTMRDLLQRVTPENRQRQILATMQDRLPSVELTRAEFEGVDDPQQPLKMRLRYMVRQCLKPAGRDLQGPLPAIWERVFLGAEAVDYRLTPFRLGVPTRVDSHISVTPPNGWQITPPTGRNSNDSFYEASAVPRMSNGRLELTAYLRRLTGDFDATLYGHFMASSNNVLPFLEQPLVLRKPLERSK